MNICKKLMIAGAVVAAISAGLVYLWNRMFIFTITLDDDFDSAARV